MEEPTKLLFIKDLLFCLLPFPPPPPPEPPVVDFDFLDMVAAAATAALLFEIRA
jgi:hypothetical protein